MKKVIGYIIILIVTVILLLVILLNMDFFTSPLGRPDPNCKILNNSCSLTDSQIQNYIDKVSRIKNKSNKEQHETLFKDVNILLQQCQEKQTTSNTETEQSPSIQ